MDFDDGKQQITKNRQIDPKSRKSLKIMIFQGTLCGNRVETVATASGALDSVCL